MVISLSPLSSQSTNKITLIFFVHSRDLYSMVSQRHMKWHMNFLLVRKRYFSLVDFFCRLKASLHRRFLLRPFSFWCMRLNGLTYEFIRPSVQSYKSTFVTHTFVTRPLNRMRQNEKNRHKNRHKNRPCKTDL